MAQRKWKPKDPSVAFFPVELRSLYMKGSDGKDRFNRLPRHYAVVDIKKNHPFSVVTDDYKLITNKEAYEQAGDIMKQVFQMTKIDEMACLNVTMPKTRSFCHIDLVHQSATFSP